MDQLKPDGLNNMIHIVVYIDEEKGICRLRDCDTEVIPENFQLISEGDSIDDLIPGFIKDCKECISLNNENFMELEFIIMNSDFSKRQLIDGHMIWYKEIGTNRPILHLVRKDRNVEYFYDLDGFLTNCKYENLQGE